MTKKYPIGTKIRFLNKMFDTGKEGVIVGLGSYGNDWVGIFIPTAHKHITGNYHPTLSDGTKFTWHCRWTEIEPISVKNQQLLFAFME